MRFSRVLFSFALASAAASLAAAPASAKPAQCFSTDDGYYSCDFRGIDSAGSFTTRARGYPTYTIEVYRPGRAYGYADFGNGRNTSLPGEYIRNRQDRACWDNTETDTQICAW
jgi:hypothetical protein